MRIRALATLVVGFSMAAVGVVAAPPTTAASPMRVDPNAYQPASLSVGLGPKGVAIGRGLGVIANSRDDSATFFDACSSKVCLPVNPVTLPLAHQVDEVKVPPDTADAAMWVAPDQLTGRAYVSSSSHGTVSVYPIAFNGLQRVGAPSAIDIGGRPTGIAVSPDGNLVYVSDEVAGVVVVYDMSAATKAALIRVGPKPWGVVLSPDGSRAYVAIHGGASVDVIDTLTRNVIASIPVGQAPGDLALDPSGGTLFVTSNVEGSVAIVDTKTNATVTTVKVGSQPWGVAVTDSAAFVANFGSGNVSVISTSSNKVVATVATGFFPFGVAVNGDQTVMVTNTGSGTVSTIAQKATAPAVAWSSSRKRKSVMGVVPWMPAVTYNMVATNGTSTRHGSCSTASNARTVACAVRLAKGSWRVSIQTKLPWQPTPYGQQNKRFTF